MVKAMPTIHESALAEDQIDFPPAPWRLRGYGFQTLRAVPASAVLPLVPKGARIVSVWPGTTLGCVYFASYEPGSTLVYHEVIVAAGLVWLNGRLGFVLPRLYVDNPQSYAGGHAIWGMPKEMATFSIDERGVERVIDVRQDGREVIRLRFGPPGWNVPVWMTLPAFGVRDTDVLFTVGWVRTQLASVEAHVTLPQDSPFAALHLDGRSRGVAYKSLNIWVSAAGLAARTDSPPALAAPCRDSILAGERGEGR
jgi:acetoacetate decarboxylase